ncbi:MAG: membrane dipeptidase [Anaerolineales bacterium]
MPLIVDSHQDLAWNMLTFGRDYTRSAEETRQIEQGTPTIARNGDTLLGWPDYQRGQVSVIFVTLFSTPARWAFAWETVFYKDTAQAKEQYNQQLDMYHKLTDEHPDKFRVISSASSLDDLLASQKEAISAGQTYPVGLVPLMEGSDCIEHPDEVESWHERGLRIIGPAWAGTRYCGGTNEPGPLTKEGRLLLEIMAEQGFTLDISHMDEKAALQALDSYEGAIIATHANCLSLLPGSDSNRHLSDRVIQSLIERDGVMGVIPFNRFLKPGWLLSASSRREEISLDMLAAHIDHICQIAGNTNHTAIGSDFDGGFGLQATPIEIDTIADLQKLQPLLAARGYSQTDIDAILGKNWLNQLHKTLTQ